MTPQEIEYLKGLPNYGEIEFAGQRRPWLIGDLSLQRLKAKGIEPHELLGSRLIEAQARVKALQSQVAEMDEDAALTAIAAGIPVDVFTHHTAINLWAGFTTFDPEITLEFVQAVVNPRNYRAFNERMAEIRARVNADLVADTEAMETEGKAPAPVAAPGGAGAQTTS